MRQRTRWFGLGLVAALGVVAMLAQTSPSDKLSLFAPTLTNAGQIDYPAMYLQYRDQETQNTAGGTFTSGAWRTRVLNTEVSDVGGFGTLASNQITLAAGTYLIRAQAPAFKVSRHQARLQNVTDSTTVLIGTSGFTATGVNNDYSFISGVFTIAASKALELQHQCSATEATNGFGVEANFTTEVYAVVEFWKIG